MKTLGKKIVIRRGETFVLSREVVMNDGITPYVLSANRPNQYLVITISSCAYRTNGRYHCNYWLDLSNYLKFKRSTPEFLQDKYFNSNSLYNGYEKYDCIFYRLDDTNSKVFYYYNGTTYEPYSFTFSKKFLNTDTRDWVESKYMYEFKLLSGDKSIDVLTDVYKSVFDKYINIPDDELTLYNEIYKVRPDLLKYIKPGEPITNISVFDVLQKPEYCIVKSNI